MTGAPKRVRVVVSGLVQGVNFRWMCRREAEERGVAGFARNRPDGRVEAAFEGSEGDVDAMVEWCRTGPPWARVTHVEVFPEEPTGETGFHVRR